MIKAVIFDLDNTLIDFMGTKIACCNAAIDAMKKAGLKTPKRKAMKTLFELYDKKGIEYQKIFQPLLKTLAGKVDYKVMASGIIAYRRMKNEKLIAYPNVRKVLEKLGRKYRLAILSDAPIIQAWSRLVEMGLENYFDAVVAYENTRKYKPHPKPFLAIAKKLGVRPEECVMVGDNLLRDVKGAKALNMVTILAAYGNTGAKKADVKPDACLKDLKSLPKIIDSFNKVY